MRFADARILVFCKAPAPGEVKTRLAAILGDAAACEIHASLARRMIGEALEGAIAPVELWCDPDPAHPFFKAFDTERYAQQGRDLGERMHHALASALSQASVSRAVLVGTDCPPIDRDYLTMALNALDDQDAVIGPAEDGGYGLIGLRLSQPEVFTGIEWGTSSVATETCARFVQSGLRYSVLPTIWDVDRPEDVDRWRVTTGQPATNR